MAAGMAHQMARNSVVEKELSKAQRMVSLTAAPKEWKKGEAKESTMARNWVGGLDKPRAGLRAETLVGLRVPRREPRCP